MTAAEIRVSPAWLDLREPADAAARAGDLIVHLMEQLPARGLQVIHDLACGTGSMGRWLAPLLPGPQRWIAHDRDLDLLAVAVARRPGTAADGAAVTVETALSDITRLGGGLSGATLITASALLDLLTAEELDHLIDLCIASRCPVLVTLSVSGRVGLAPADPLDVPVARAFDAHQRRTTDRGRLLGPDAADAAVAGFRRRGAEVLVSPSPWRLGPDDAGLAAEWLAGWVGAACEQEPGLVPDADAYLRRRLAQARSGRLSVTVDHADLLVLP
jgi:hypothetical protein